MNYAVTNNQNIFALSENSAVGLSYLTLQQVSTFNDWFFEPPAIVKPQMNAMGTTIYAHLINNGLLYPKMTARNYVSPKFGYPAAWPEVSADKQLDYSVFPFSVASTQYYQSIYYDNKYGRFAYVSQTSTLPVLNRFIETPGQAFDMNDVGMEMVFMGQSPSSVYTAVMKDKVSSQAYLIQFSSNIGTNVSASVRKAPLSAPNILSFSAAATSTLSQQLYYAVGNNIYLYDIASDLTREIFSFPGEESVTQMKSAVVAGNLQVYMATVDAGGAGKFYIFDVDGTGNFINNSYTQVYGGFGKIVDMILKQ